MYKVQPAKESDCAGWEKHLRAQTSEKKLAENFPGTCFYEPKKMLWVIPLAALGGLLLWVLLAIWLLPWDDIIPIFKEALSIP